MHDKWEEKKILRFIHRIHLELYVYLVKYRANLLSLVIANQIQQKNKNKYLLVANSREMWYEVLAMDIRSDWLVIKNESIRINHWTVRRILILLDFMLWYQSTLFCLIKKNGNSWELYHNGHLELNHDEMSFYWTFVWLKHFIQIDLSNRTCLATNSWSTQFIGEV